MSEKKSKKTKTKKATPPEIAAKGGAARDKALTPERKKEIAKAAAAARWGAKPLLATHRGNFKEVFGIDVECYVLNDEQKTAVVSKRGMAAALQLGRGRGRGKGLSGTQLSRFLSSETLADYVGPDLVKKIANPLVFQWPNVGPDAPPGPIHGYDPALHPQAPRARQVAPSIESARSQARRNVQTLRAGTTPAKSCSASQENTAAYIVRALRKQNSAKEADQAIPSRLCSAGATGRAR